MEHTLLQSKDTPVATPELTSSSSSSGEQWSVCTSSPLPLGVYNSDIPLTGVWIVKVQHEYDTDSRRHMSQLHIINAAHTSRAALAVGGHHIWSPLDAG